MSQHKHMLSPSSLSKIIGVLARNGGGKTNFFNHNYYRNGSMSLLNMALLLSCPGWGYFISYRSLASMDLGTLFDLSSTHCLIIMTFDTLMSSTANSVNVPPICSREVDLWKNNLPLIAHTILFHNILSLSHVDDVGNIMAHLRSRSLPVDFSSLSRKLI